MRKNFLIAGVIIVIVGALYYGISPIFITKIADDQISSSAVQRGTVAEVVGTVGHPAEGTVRIVEEEGTRFVRYENFKTLNGPDLFVYLAKDKNASEFVNLGRLTATEGSVNYEIPADINPEEYPYVLTWCKAFGVLFNSAKVF